MSISKGDATVPKLSSLGQFEDDPRAIENAKIVLTEVAKDQDAEIPSKKTTHGAITANGQIQKAILEGLGLNFSLDASTTDFTAGKYLSGCQSRRARDARKCIPPGDFGS